MYDLISIDCTDEESRATMVLHSAPQTGNAVQSRSAVNHSGFLHSGVRSRSGNEPMPMKSGHRKSDTRHADTTARPARTLIEVSGQAGAEW